MTISTLADLVDRHGVDVDDHLDRADIVPVLTGLQCQGDLIVVPQRKGKSAGQSVPVPPAGIPVIRGESGGNTHLLLADGDITWTETARAGQNIGVVDIPAGATAWLAHEEHGYVGIAPGSYVLRRQREQADEIRMVAD